jgi:DNA-binding MarR family transcriptional regulator
MQISTSFQRLNKRVEEQIGLSIVQFHLLRTLKEHPGISSLELARATRLHPSTLTQSLRRLVRKGFVFIDKDPRDSRRTILTATRQGRNAIIKFTATFPKLMGDIPELMGQDVVETGS